MSGSTGSAVATEQRQGPMTLGQVAQLLEYEAVLRQAPQLAWTRNLAFGWKLRGEFAPDRVLKALRVLARRHEALRTTFRRSADGNPIQAVHPYDESVAVVIEPGEAAERGWSGDDVQARRMQTFVIDQRPPVRFHLLCRAAAVTEMIFVAHHIVVDVRGAQILFEDLSVLLATDDAGLADVRQPIEAALQQASADQSGAIAQWRRFLDAVPPSPFPRLNCSARTRTYTADFDSPSLGRHTASVARTHRLLPAQVLLGAFAGAMAAYTGVPETAIGVIAANRFSDARGVHCRALRIPVVLSCGEPAHLSKILAEVKALTRLFHSDADYDARAVGTMQNDARRRSGHDTSIRIEFNFLSRRPLAGAAGASAHSAGRFAAVPGPAADPNLLYFEARYRGADMPMRLSIQASESFLPMSGAEEVFHATETAVGRLACGDSSPIVIGDPGRRAGLVRYRSGLVDLDHVRTVISDLAGCPVEIAVAAEESRAAELVAFIPDTMDAGGRDALREALLVAAESDPALVVPTTLVPNPALSAS